VNYAEVLEKYLFRIARGELSDLDSLVPLIPPSVFYMPVLSEVLSGNNISIKLPVVERSNRNYLPIFIRRSHLLASYDKLKVSAQEIRGDTLLEVLPVNFGVLFEPNSSLEVSFDRKDLGLEEPDSVTVMNEEAYSSLEPKLPEALEDLFSGNQPKSVSLVEIKKLEEVLRADLSSFEEVLEAFFMPHVSSYSDAILGLLREEMDDERRYDLSESVAKTSTDFYGYAGAIEIFDDLINPDSNAWTNFQSETPFYKRDKITDRIEISKTDSMGRKKDGLFGSLENFRRSGLKIFSS